ncbi:ATP-binding cassette domain-containing protein [Streptococcus thermophilus]|uniref:ATP-binding cassette domain-containing protein n=1 Tax=Streptococcus thermophilus TaxID=1308 RepID=UPI00131F92A2|nr:ABC transporter ATP-binding protein [Streptococcus thermophilus]MBZ5809228.1 ABC transporter ATP-binding protein [Streptococcus thermophilus]MBZ5839408.1 ABC transporter ATP-binding protein [Streptococcus thermophilus]MCW2490613.1 ABC transporter ATP-binding protein [Streptococcus thermophilus]QHD72287.1 ATP-binding cassette domain-containing protein [Streptococcus thermophilus]
MDCYSIENLYQTYKNSDGYVNKNINLKIKQGDLIGFYGENGSGKSTLLKALAGVKSVSKGRIFYNGKLLKADKRNNKSISYCPQNSLTLDFIPIINLIELTARFKGYNKNRATKESLYWLKKFDILHISDKDMTSISGGERKLVSLICSFIGEYDVLLLDEPTNELDPEKRKIVWSSIRELHNKGKTIILVTHEVNESQDIVERVVFFSDGELIMDESINDLKDLYENRCKVRINESSDKIIQIKENILGNNKFQVVNESSFFLELLLNRTNFAYLDEIVLKKLDIKEYSVSTETLLDFLGTKR